MLLSGEYKIACESDLTTHCKDVEQGHGRLGKCLESHEEQLEPDCKKIMKRHKEIKKEHSSFSPSFQDHCSKEKELLCANFDASESAAKMSGLAGTFIGKLQTMPQFRVPYGDDFFCLADQTDDPRISAGCAAEIARRSMKLLGEFDGNPLLKTVQEGRREDQGRAPLLRRGSGGG